MAAGKTARSKERCKWLGTVRKMNRRFGDTIPSQPPPLLRVPGSFGQERITTSQSPSVPVSLAILPAALNQNRNANQSISVAG